MTGGKKSLGQESSFQKTVNILLPFLIYFIVHDLAQIILAFLLSGSFGIFGEEYTQFIQANAASVNGVLNALALLIGMAAVLPMAMKELRLAAVVRGYEKSVDMEKSELVTRILPMVGRKRIGYTILTYGILIVLAISLALGMNILLTLTGLTQSSNNYTEVATRQYGVAWGLGILLYGVVSPLAEEVVFRGVIYNRMKQYFRVPLAIVVCGVLFGIYHGNLVQGIYGSILGIVITLVYEWYDSFLAPLLFHGAANVSVFIVSYDAERYHGLTTLWNGLVFMAVAVLSLLIIVWMRKSNLGDSK